MRVELIKQKYGEDQVQVLYVIYDNGSVIHSGTLGSVELTYFKRLGPHHGIWFAGDIEDAYLDTIQLFDGRAKELLQGERSFNNGHGSVWVKLP